MSCHVMSCHVMSCHVMSCHVMSCHVMSCHVMSCHVMSCHVTSCHVMSCHIMPFHVTSSHIMSCHVTSCHVVNSYSYNMVPSFITTIGLGNNLFLYLCTKRNIWEDSDSWIPYNLMEVQQRPLSRNISKLSTFLWLVSGLHSLTLITINQITYSDLMQINSMLVNETENSNTANKL